MHLITKLNASRNSIIQFKQYRYILIALLPTINQTPSSFRRSSNMKYCLFVPHQWHSNHKTDFLIAATCLAVTELGPCYSALQYETQVEAAEGKSETCKKYLEDTLSKCAQKNVSQSIDSCKQHCSKYLLVLPLIMSSVFGDLSSLRNFKSLDDILNERREGWREGCWRWRCRREGGKRERPKRRLIDALRKKGMREAGVEEEEDTGDREKWIARKGCGDPE